MKSIKLCGVQLHFPYEPYPQQINISRVVLRSCVRLQNGALEVPTGCGKTMGLLCSVLGFQVDQRYKLLEALSADDSLWDASAYPCSDCTAAPAPGTPLKNGCCPGTPPPGPRPYADSSGTTPPRPQPYADSSGTPQPKPRPYAGSPGAPQPKPRPYAGSPGAPQPKPRPYAGSPARPPPPPPPPPPPQRQSPAKAAARKGDGRSFFDKLAVPEDDDDDFLPRRGRGRGRQKTAWPAASPAVAACKKQCLSSAADPPPASGRFSPGISSTCAGPCGVGLELPDIEALSPIPRPPRAGDANGSVREDHSPLMFEDEGEDEDAAAPLAMTEAEPEVIVLSSDDSQGSSGAAGGGDCGDCGGCGGAYGGGCGDYGGAGSLFPVWFEGEEELNMSFSRQQAKQLLSQRSRQPAPAGEYGPTRLVTAADARHGKVRVPKVFYASRTHMQLEQVAKEIKKTAYCDARVVVLSSRERTCVNDRDFSTRNYANRTEMCRSLMDSDCSMQHFKTWEEAMKMDESFAAGRSMCHFYRNNKEFEGHDRLFQNTGLGPVVELTSLVKTGRKHKFCPYFLARDLVSTADIVLCPVNYLIDPLIRKSMNMDLKGEIVIVDEAHMLEDLCRDTASLIVAVDDLKECHENCKDLSEKKVEESIHAPMAFLLHALVQWIDFNSKKAITVGYKNEKELSLPSLELMASLNHAGITPDAVNNFVISTDSAAAHKAALLADPKNSPAYISFHSITSKTQNMCERLALILDFLINHPKDYVGSVMMTSVKFQQDVDAPTQAAGYRDGQQWALKLVCQNSALIFNLLSSDTRSIIFSSATLSPMPGFAAELGITLHNVTVDGHVIPPSQTWVGCLGRGRNGHELYGRYSNTKSPEYMDEVGQVVLDVCEQVPFGVLVFVTAYWTLENIVKRWMETGLWALLKQHKLPLQERRRATEFEAVLTEFYASVEDAHQAMDSGLVRIGSGQTGPLLLAVMRGKVSEGFNFADHSTRAIITVGIPYPNINEATIRWKRDYNKKNTHRNLQDAEGWYNTQAFRALSQSLGRGLRHRYDWCALILLDARLQQPKYYSLLPGWIHERMIIHRQYAGMLRSIGEFIQRMTHKS